MRLWRCVSNAILDKPGKLDDAEWEIMRMHAAHSEAILSRIGAFSKLAPIAGAHHERLDGKGYPRGLSGDQICLEIRIITTADIFDALTAERPYRAAMPITKALAIMSGMVGTQIDADFCSAQSRAWTHRRDAGGLTGARDVVCPGGRSAASIAFRGPAKSKY